MSLTIKHCLPGGEEFLYHVEPHSDINYVPSRAKGDPATFDYDSLWFDFASLPGVPRRRYELTGGKAYVMNATGATVATYWLGGERAPIGVPVTPAPASAPSISTNAT